jgi:hypothetical protein
MQSLNGQTPARIGDAQILVGEMQLTAYMPWSLRSEEFPGLPERSSVAPKNRMRLQRRSSFNLSCSNYIPPWSKTSAAF